MRPSAFRSLTALAVFGITAIASPGMLRAQSAESPTRDGASVSAPAAVNAASLSVGASIPFVVAPSAAITASTTAGASVAPAGLQALTALRSGEAPSNNANNANAGSNVALMGVGAAGLIVGLLIGGDAGSALAIGGGVVGLVGLYRYLR